MKILFTYNARIECDESGNWYGNEINNEVISRYRSMQDEITFLVRKRLIRQSESANLTRLEQRTFDVVFVPEFNSVGKYFLNLKYIHKIIKEAVEKSDVIISRMPSTISRIAIRYAKMAGKPYLVEVVGCPWDALWNYSLEGKLLAPFAFLKMKGLVRNAPFVVYVTNKFLQSRYPNKHENISISDVILTKHTPDVLEQKIHTLSQSFKEKKIVIGTAGGLDVPYKGHSLVLKAIYELRKKGFNARYIVAGKGNGNRIRNEINRLGISDHVEIVGQIPFGEMSAFYDRLDIYIQPSLQEGLPRALVEAMNRACPCIGSCTGGIPELLDERYVLKNRNPVELADLIIKTDTSDWVDQARRNSKKAEEFYPDLLQKKRMDFFSRFKQFYNLS